MEAKEASKALSGVGRSLKMTMYDLNDFSEIPHRTSRHSAPNVSKKSFGGPPPLSLVRLPAGAETGEYVGIGYRANKVNS